MLIINPTAGRERAKYHKENLRRQLENMFDDVELRETEKAGDATLWAKEAALIGFDAVFSMGGDGTLNETINGLAQANKPIDFGFIPLGTINDLARALNIPLHPEVAIDMLPRCKTVKVDIAKANDRYFINTIATGIMPEAVGHVSIEQKTRLGPLAYFLTGIKAMQAHETSLFKITTPEGSSIYRSPLIVAMLTNSVGSFRNLAPQARVDDGKIWLGIFKDFNYLDLLKVIPEFLSGQPLTSELMTLKALEEVRIELVGDHPLSTNMDGDSGPAFPLDIKVLPSFLSVYVPE
ncbi:MULTISPECIES: diacylglycerol/lipid kinase family protein [Megasphaera]|nr:MULTISPECIES: diacylglycerol kinase family protein [Megasphaera]MBS6137097.1 diacylglycerol kinase family lipid kinase [Megasphaera sp.]MSB88200.1 YegS/Rv2252/BmrU family lipid kinase [Megasphaera sp. BIOML-A1]KXA69748.1 lipid kinase, YegS/Rv2252/BmrU family [Megasphaera sp. MJR8396C]MDU3111894.1 diacylglycerol kinase family lipid kinase [Megasphaera sp.]MED9920284.1 diacylglycerol kinase family protein [Megasphaera sp.]